METDAEGRGARVTLVTGGTGGLGRWVVRELLERGDRVGVAWRTEEEARALEEFVGPRREALRLHRADVTDPGEVAGLVEAAAGEDRRVDALCNLVGGYRGGRITDTDPSTWRRMLELNATSTFLCCRAVAPVMAARGRGWIVNVASRPALEGGPRMSAYAAAKAAVHNLTLSLARELGPEGIAVNAVAPSTIDTPENREAMPEADRSRWLHPRDIARVVAFLTSEDAAIVRGTTLTLARG